MIIEKAIHFHRKGVHTFISETDVQDMRLSLSPILAIFELATHAALRLVKTPITEYLDPNEVGDVANAIQENPEFQQFVEGILGQSNRVTADTSQDGKMKVLSVPPIMVALAEILDPKHRLKS